MTDRGQAPEPDDVEVRSLGSGPPIPPGRWTSWRHELSEEGARGALIAFVATLVFLAVALWMILHSSTWPKVQQQFFNPDDFRMTVGEHLEDLRRRIMTRFFRS